MCINNFLFPFVYYLNFPDEDILLFGKAKDAREFPN
jgi:hypothetical protein